MRIESVEIGASGVAKIVAGGSSFLLRISRLEELGLALPTAGSELDEEAEATVRLAAETYEAESRALLLLARAEQSTFMLRSKLEVRGFDGRAVRAALSRLESLGFLDDRRFAIAYASSRLARRAEGPLSLRAALQSRGIDASLAKEVADSQFSGEERSKLLAKALERELKRSGGDAKIVRSRLRRLGFGSGEISSLDIPFRSLHNNAE
jgi:SOS response regulatory protein OraA/RecX